MDTLVTLIVKAPNQQIEDQTIKCELSWTIQKLKQHLSEVYPSRPPKHEQKLIYSGQLLSDSLTLKDVLRQFEGQETHTVHLVCSSKYTKDIQEQTPVSQASTPNNTNQQTNTPSQSQETTPTATTDQNVPNVPPNISWFNLNNPPVTPMDPNQYALQVALMQQAYFQYMAQYMQLAAANSFAANPQQIPINGDIPGQIPPNQAEQPPAVPEAPPAAVRDPENPERDWLDIFYMLSRVMVLISVVYFYSSPLRFIVISILGISLYLYQIGFFRNINNNNNNNNNGPPEQVQEEEQAPSRFTIVWTFFSTFFASLIPEIPNAL